MCIAVLFSNTALNKKVINNTLLAIGYLILKVKTASVFQFLLINIISYGICFMLYEIYRRVRKIDYSLWRKNS